MADLAFRGGVDFNRADPADRDWKLHLLLALRSRVMADEKAATIESSRQFLSVVGGFAASASKGRNELLGEWEKNLDRLTGTILGLSPEESVARGPARGTTEELKAQYIARFGDPLDPAFVEYDRAVADWISRGDDLKGKPPPQRPGVTVAAQ